MNRARKSAPSPKTALKPKLSKPLLSKQSYLYTTIASNSNDQHPSLIEHINNDNNNNNNKAMGNNIVTKSTNTRHRRHHKHSHHKHSHHNLSQTLFHSTRSTHFQKPATTTTTTTTAGYNSQDNYQSRQEQHAQQSFQQRPRWAPPPVPNVTDFLARDQQDSNNNNNTTEYSSNNDHDSLRKQQIRKKWEEQNGYNKNNNGNNSPNDSNTSSHNPTRDVLEKQLARNQSLQQEEELFRQKYPKPSTTTNNQFNQPSNPNIEQLSNPTLYNEQLDPPDARKHFRRLADQLEEYELQYGPGKPHKYTVGKDMLHKHENLDNFQHYINQPNVHIDQLKSHMENRSQQQIDQEEDVQKDEKKNSSWFSWGKKKKSNDGNNTNPKFDNKHVSKMDKYAQNDGLQNKIPPFQIGLRNPIHSSSTHNNTTQQRQQPQPPQQPPQEPPQPQKKSWFSRFKRLSPIIEQSPTQIRHLWRIAKQIKSEESLLLFQAEFKQARKLLFSEHNIKRTKLELNERVKFAEEYIDRKLKEPYIDPTTEYRLQQKEVLHDKIIDMHYTQDRLIDKIRAKVHIFSETISSINTDPRKREILARKVFFTSLDDDSLISRIAKIIYFPFGLLLRGIVTSLSMMLFTVELFTSKLIPEIALISRTLRKNISDYSLTPNNILQLLGLIALSSFIATIGHDIASLYLQSITTPRGSYVDVANTFLYVNSEEMIYDSVREMVANRLLITPQTYSEMYSPYGIDYFRVGRVLKSDTSPIDIPQKNAWGTPDRISKQLSLIQPIFTQMKQDLVHLYKDRFYLPLERLTEGLRTHSVSMGFTVEALDGFLDVMYMRDTRTRLDEEFNTHAHNQILNYLFNQDFLLLPPGDVIRSQAPGEIYHHVVANFRTLEGKDSTLGGELFKDYIKLGSRVAYRKKLLHEIEMLTELRSLLENARFPHVTIPQRDIKKIACDLNDPITKAVMSHLEELRLADSTSPLYPSRTARQLLESSYQIDSRHTHFSKDETIVNDHYLLLCNMDNPRYTYDSLCNHRNLQFQNNDQRDIFERHLYHFGMVLNKIDAILVQNYIELRHIEHHVINPLNPLEGNVIGVMAKDIDLAKLTLPHLDDVVNKSHTLALPQHAIGSGQVMLERLDQNVDMVEYDRHHYQNMIQQRTKELKAQLTAQQHPFELQQQQQSSSQGPINNAISSLSNWWYGKPRKQSSSFSTEFDSVLQWQATRDVLATVHNDPYLHRRYIQDYGAETLFKYEDLGYVSSDSISPEMRKVGNNITPMDQALGDTHFDKKQQYNFNFAQNLFSPPSTQQIPAAIDFYGTGYENITPGRNIDSHGNVINSRSSTLH